MEKYSLWYVKQQDAIRGAFPEKVLVDLILLGRVQENDQISQDKEHWRTLNSLPHFVLDVLDIDPEDPQRDVKVALAKRRADERQAGQQEAWHGEERRVHVSPVDAPAIIEVINRITLFPIFAMGVVVLFVMAIAFSFQGDLEISASDCEARPAMGVNWQNCKKPGGYYSYDNFNSATLVNGDFTASDFTGARFNSADLSYADFSGSVMVNGSFTAARMSGVNLSSTRLAGSKMDEVDADYGLFRNADLTGVDFRRADLANADMRGAIISDASFSGADLGSAIWIDGRICQAGSVGRCN